MSLISLDTTPNNSSIRISETTDSPETDSSPPSAVTVTTADAVPPKSVFHPPRRGLRYGDGVPLIGDIIHLVSDDGVCCAAVVSMTFPERPTDVLVTLFPPTPGSGSMCVGLARHHSDHEPRTWHDPYKCKGERRPDKARRLIGA